MNRASELDSDAHEAVNAAFGALLVVVTCLAVATAASSGDAGRAAFTFLSFAPLGLALALALAPRVPSRLLAGMVVGTPALPVLEVLDDRTAASEHAPGALAAAAAVLPVAAFILALGIDGLLASVGKRAGSGHGMRVVLALSLAAGLILALVRHASVEGVAPSAASRFVAIVLTTVALLVFARRLSRLRAWVAKAEPAVAARDLARTRSGALVKLEGAPVPTREVVFLERSDSARNYRGDGRGHARQWITSSALRAMEDRARRFEWLALFVLLWLGLPTLT
jgi:hypothetical protein